MTKKAEPTELIRVYTSDRDVLNLIRLEYMRLRAGENLTLPQTIRQLLEDCRPDLMGVEPPLKFNISMETRVRVKDVAEMLGITGPDAFEEVILHLLQCCYPHIHGHPEE